MSESRLDVALVRLALSPSRERAQAAIAAGMVLVNGSPALKPAVKVSAEDRIEVTGDPIGYVGRGGLKLEAALDRFEINPADQVCLDAGASTGGFTECLLRRGARLVYAVDVGRDQLHPALRSDSRVVAMEGTDIRTLAELPLAPVLVSIDVSFISLTMVLPAVLHLSAPEATIVALIKPQFEVGPERLGKGGVVRNPLYHTFAVERIRTATASLGLHWAGLMESPVRGTEGNLEYLAWLKR